MPALCFSGLVQNIESTSATPAPLSHRLQYYGLRAAVGFFAALPRSLALRLGAWLGELFYALDAKDRRVALLNLSIAFPAKSESSRRQILRASCRNLGRLAAEVCQLAKLDAASLAGIVDFADRAAWDGVWERAAERGVVILTAHFGNWEMLAYMQGLLGHPITLVHRPMRNVMVDGAIAALRSGAGTRSIRKKAAAKEAIRTLRQKGVVAIPSDQNQTHSYGVFVDFFGKPACTTPGVARLAMLTGAAVIPAFLVREGEGARHRIEILPAVEMARSGDREADIVTNTQRCSDVVEDMIRRYPEQWIWFHKRWKTRPHGEPKLYT
jgi:KDO2-lipid IV(A) lauroyltransferase